VPDCHSDSAKATASWVLPDDLSQFCASGAATGPGKAAGAAARSGTSATAAPAGSAAGRAGAVSSLALKPSASAGTVPDRIGHDGRPGAAFAGRVAGERDGFEHHFQCFDVRFEIRREAALVAY